MLDSEEGTTESLLGLGGEGGIDSLASRVHPAGRTSCVLTCGYAAA